MDSFEKTQCAQKGKSFFSHAAKALLVLLALTSLILAAGITTCQTLNSANTMYRLTANPTAQSLTCFNITATNITLNGNGYKISGLRTINITGIFVNAQNATVANLSIANCLNITVGTDSFLIGSGC